MLLVLSGRSAPLPCAEKVNSSIIQIDVMRFEVLDIERWNFSNLNLPAWLTLDILAIDGKSTNVVQQRDIARCDIVAPDRDNLDRQNF